MTGFGKGVAEANNKKYTVELKSLNSKQLDMNSRVPHQLRSLELEMRSAVAHALLRGKVDMTVSIEALPGATCQAQLNVPVLEGYRRQVSDACKALGVAEPTDWMPLLMRMPDVMISEQTEDDSEAVKAAVMSALSEAIEGLTAHRRAEGERLESFFAERIKGISDLLVEVAPYAEERVPAIRARIEEALTKIPVAELDKGRLEQEMIFYIEKLDVNEEQQRLSQHLRYFMETMEAEAGQGKKLGFVAQEMGREINTLGSKSNQADMQRIVVRMKDILEQIKEQVLNVL